MSQILVELIKLANLIISITKSLACAGRISTVLEMPAEEDGGSGSADSDEDSGSDPMLKQAVEVVIDAGQASTSLLQRRCKLGYARAARIMDEMEQKGIIGPYEGAKPRAVLISRQQWLEMQMNQPDE